MTANDSMEPAAAAALEKRANVIGVGLIGGSVGMALRSQGWHVSATDADSEVSALAVTVGAADAAGFDEAAALTVVAVPVGQISEIAADALRRTAGVVTDVGSTKLDIARAVDDPRFVGGHPMAGSEHDGLVGSRANLFEGAMWVLTPTEDTDEGSFQLVRSVVRSFGAETIALHPRMHDQMVAQVSHVPHLTAASLMCLADDSSIEHRALLRLAAGGFRDMTRISAGRPSIWPDICVANKTAITKGLDDLIERLQSVRGAVANQDRGALLELLHQARVARVNLPTGFGLADNMAEVTVPVPDRPGEIAAITTLAAELDVNIFDLDLTHSGEGRKGVMRLMIDATMSERLTGGLVARGYRPRVRSLE